MTFLGWLQQPAVLPWVAAAFGLCVGSFLNVVIHRLPKMLEREWRAECAALACETPPPQEPYNLVVPRSRCPSCGIGITALQNIPVLSFVLLKGRCYNCKTRISAKYPLVELLAALGAGYSAWRFGFSPAALCAAVFVWSAIALAWIDQEHGYLPDDITLPLMWVGLLANVEGAFAPLDEAVVGAAAGYMVLWSVNAGFKALRGIDGMGYGDFKMTAAVGAFLGWKPLFMVILLSSVVGLVFGSVQMFAARRGWDWRFKFHFGPYIAIAALAAMFWGAQIARLVPVLRPFP